MKKSFLSVASIFILGTLAALGQLVFPGKKTSLAEIADVYQAQKAAPIEDFAYASDEPAAMAINRNEQRASLTADPDKILNELESDEDHILAHPDAAVEADEDGEDGEAAAAKQDDSRVTLLEAQQATFVQEIARLKKELRSANSEAVASANSAPQADPSSSNKDKENIKLLASHILQLRSNLQAEKEATAAKTAEVDALKSRIEHLERTSNEAKQDNSNSLQRGEQLASAVVGLREKLAGLESEKKEIGEQLRAKDEELRQMSDELEETKRQLSRTIEDARSCNISLEDEKKAVERERQATEHEKQTASGIPVLESKIGELQGTIAERDKEITGLKTQLADREQIVGSIPAMKKELLAAKNQLLMKEKELQLVGKGASVHTGVSRAEQEKLIEQSGRRAGEESIHGKSEPLKSDVMVVEVLGSRVALRSGPSPDDSEIMPVGKGTRLTVEERKGEWYRVVAPNSMRAYIRSDMVRILTQGGSSSSEQAAAASDADSAPRAPKKVARKVAQPDGEMESFGNVDSQPTDRESRALQRLRAGMEGNKPSAPEMIP